MRELLACGLAVAVALAAGSGRVDIAWAKDDKASLDGDLFVGASVFLFERTVLSAFAPAGTTDGMLDAGVIVFAQENAISEDGAVALEAILGWLGAAAPAPGADAGPINGERQRALLCLAFGADPDRAPLTRRGVTEADRTDCTQRYAEARKAWDAWLQPFRRKGAAPAQDLRLAFAPTADDTDQAIADAMQKNGLFQVLTDDFNAVLSMPRPLTALLTQCGESKAFYNPDRGEAVLCYEMLAALLAGTPK